MKVWSLFLHYAFFVIYFIICLFAFFFIAGNVGSVFFNKVVWLKRFDRPSISSLARPALFRTAADKALDMTVHDKQNRDAHTFTEMQENKLEAAWTVLNETTCSLLYCTVLSTCNLNSVFSPFHLFSGDFDIKEVLNSTYFFCWTMSQCHNADVCVYVPFLRESKACTILIPEIEGGEPLSWELSHWEFHPM